MLENAGFNDVIAEDQSNLVCQNKMIMIYLI